MDNNYRIMGLAPGATDRQVKEAYRKLAAQYNPDNFTDSAQKKWAAEQMQQINRAYDEIMNSTRTAEGTRADRNEQGNEFYIYIRRLIQQGEYDTAISQLEKYQNEDDAEWQFLMGSALYYRGFISRSYSYFEKAAQMNPVHREYTATYNRMKQSRNGNIYQSPYSQEQTFGGQIMCCDPCTVCQCLICMDCCCH